MSVYDNILPGAVFQSQNIPYWAPAGSGGGGGTVSTFASATIGALSVSSINGQAQFTSSVQGISLAAQASTILCEAPLGNFSYQFVSLAPGDSWVNAGMGTQAKSGSAWIGGLGADIKIGATNASPLIPYIQAPGTSGLLSIGVANPTDSTISLAIGTVGTTL